MKLQSLTSPSLVFAHQQVKTKEEAISFLIKKLYEAGKISSYEGFLKAVHDREALSPTGFEAGLAIPHGKSEYVNEAAFAVMTVASPIEDWESIDPTNKVELVFLLAIPESEAGSTHLTLLSELVKRLSVDEYKKNLLESRTAEQLFENLDAEDKKEEKKVAVPKLNKTILAITACPAGIAHTYMAAEALIKAGQEMGIDVYVEKQGANGIEDAHTPELLQKADAVIFATDVAPKNTERFSHLPQIKTRVAAPLREAKQILQNALDAAEQNGKGEYKAQEIQQEKSSVRTEIKDALLTGVSYIIPLIVAGGMVLTLAVLLSQGLGLQELYAQDGSWLFMIRKLGGGLVGTLLVPVLSAYMAFSLADKPALAPGFAAGLAADLIGSGFLGGMLGGLIAGYTARFLKKYVPAKGTLAGFVSFWVYPVVGTMITGGLMLFVVGGPVAALNEGMVNWLNSLTGANIMILGAVIGGMVSFDLGGPVNKAAYTFAVASIASGNYIPYAIFASVKMVSAFAVTFATLAAKDIFTEDEREVGKQTWILGLAGITEGAIPFMIKDPVRVIFSLVVGSAVTGAIVAAFSLGLSVPGAGIFSLLLLESGYSVAVEAAVWFFAAVLGAIISAALLIVTRKQKLKKENNQ